MSHDPLNATLIDRDDLTDELAIIRVRPDSGVIPPFEPGQYITIGLPQDDRGTTLTTSASPTTRPRMIRRAYSVASSADQSDWLEFIVVLVREGRLTPHLWEVPVGGRLWINQKAKGQFTLQGIPTDKNLVMVSTGTGIAPYMSMLRTYQGQNRWRKFVVIHGVRLMQDLGYRQELEQSSAQDPTVLYIPTVTREPEDSNWQGLRGRVQIALEDQAFRRLTGAPLMPENCHVFLCGNPAMVTGVQALLETKGFVTQTAQTLGNLHLERYW
jgi:ferredoxin--NADP+ reductase